MAGLFCERPWTLVDVSRNRRERSVTGCVTRTMSDWCRRYRRKLHRSRGAILRPGFAQTLPSHAVRGGGAPGGAGAERRTRWPASRSDRSPDRQGSPANDAGRRASRRSTAAFLAKLSLRRSSGPGFREPALAPTRPASTSQSGPNAARLVARSRPSAGLRGLPAGAAPRSIRRTSPEDAPQRARWLHMSLFS